MVDGCGTLAARRSRERDSGFLGRAVPPAHQSRCGGRARRCDPCGRQRQQYGAGEGNPALRPSPPRKQKPQRKQKTLERVLSKAGLGSRTQARGWIHAGRVQVNGRIVEDPDRWIDFDRDRILFDGEPLERRERVYILLYKPAGYITTFKDPEGRPTVYDLMGDVKTFVSPVGRLDLDTSGLLILTNDTRFAESVTNP